MRWPHHPFPVTCTFRRCTLVNFAVDPDTLHRQLPQGLEPHLFADRAYVAIVIGQMERMRPALVPAALGITYNQIVYRAVIRANDQPGVHFLRSDADNRLMCALGDRMSFFRFHHSSIALDHTDKDLRVDVVTNDSPGADISARFDLAAKTGVLPDTSRFPDLATAQDHLVDLFTAYDRNDHTNRLESVTIDRDPWKVRAIPLAEGTFEYMQAGPVFCDDTAQLDNVLSVTDVRYHWHRLQHPTPTSDLTARDHPALER